MTPVRLMYCAIFVLVFVSLQLSYLSVPRISPITMWCALSIGLPMVILLTVDIKLRDLLTVAFGVGKSKAGLPQPS